MKLDIIHSQILEKKKKNTRISNTAIAKQVGISSPSVAERLSRLEDSEIIEGNYTKVFHIGMGYDFRALTLCMLLWDVYNPFFTKLKCLMR